MARPYPRIYKYPLPAFGQYHIAAAVTRWLHVAWQEGTLHVWAEVFGPTDESPQHTLYVAMTGDSVDPGWQYLGSASTPDSDGSPYVVHVYLVP